MQKNLKDISPECFPIWGETLNYERGMPEFRQPPEFSEEGVLVPNAEGCYSYERIRKQAHKPSSSRLSTTELEDSSPRMTLPPSPNEYKMSGSSYPALGQQTPLASAQSTNNHIYDQPSGEGSSFGVYHPFNAHYPHPDVFQGPHYMYGNPAESSAMQEIEEQMYPRAFFTPNVDSSPGSTSTPHSMQWNPFGPVSSYGQVQYSLDHNGMTPPQTDTQMADSFWPYGTDLQ
ncbi:hypothetical protein M378DRAFT_622528 [Amanita muscaria Koide BX008]|uniref:Uncharacterized protein n=1 Tax=Amanita muscaria (strain Koide BX008) TaxID=946122 RepID=A0A0C2XMQ7_AMAMK|nr:hypothetical protein M378DRAFT_622528 [Amanita muscaria Koide BX008]